MVEHLIEDQGVSGSIPLITTSVKGLGDGLMFWNYLYYFVEKRRGLNK